MEQAGAIGEEGRAMRVLVADDDAITRKILQSSLIRCGYEVITLLGWNPGMADSSAGITLLILSSWTG